MEAQRLVDEHTHLVHELARAQRGNRDLATEDMVGICYLGLVAAASGYDPSLGPFMQRASRHIKGYIKHALRDASQVPGYMWDTGERFPDSLDCDLPLEEKTPVFSEAPEDLALHILLKDAVNALPDRQRAIFRMRLAGHSFTEIGDAFGVSSQAVNNAYNKACGRLRRHLTPILPEYT